MSPSRKTYGRRQSRNTKAFLDKLSATTRNPTEALQTTANGGTLPLFLIENPVVSSVKMSEASNKPTSMNPAKRKHSPSPREPGEEPSAKKHLSSPPSLPAVDLSTTIQSLSITQQGKQQASEVIDQSVFPSSSTIQPHEALSTEIQMTDVEIKNPEETLGTSTQIAIADVTKMLGTIDRELWPKILGLVVGSGTIIKPWYKQGMLDKRSGYFSLEIKEECILRQFNDRNVIWADNVDLSFLRVCRDFYKIGVKLFYSSHTFEFNDPDACS